MSRTLVLVVRVAPLALLVVSLVMSGVAVADPCPSASAGGC